MTNNTKKGLKNSHAIKNITHYRAVHEKFRKTCSSTVLHDEGSDSMNLIPCLTRVLGQFLQMQIFKARSLFFYSS